MTFASQPNVTTAGIQRFANSNSVSVTTSSGLKQTLANGTKRKEEDVLLL